MANEDLVKMRQGVMDPAGESMTKAGRIIAIVSLVLVLFSIVFGVLGAVVQVG